MTIRILFAAFLTAALASPFVPSLGAAGVLGVAWLASTLAETWRELDLHFRRELETRLASLEAKPDASAQLEALSQKIHDPTNGLAEQIRQLRNLAAFKR